MKSQIWLYIPQTLDQNPLFRVDYSLYSQQQLRNILKHWIVDEAVRRKYVEGITIDGAESKDLDDAIWAERTQKWYVVFIHISDVTEAIKIYSPLDLEALKRTTSIYRKERVLNMFPPELANDLLSLDENGKKLTLSMQIELDFQWNIVYYDVFESQFKNQKRYDYETFLDDFNNPDADFHDSLHLMYEIAKKRRNYRSLSWATLDLDETDRRISLWEKTQKLHHSEKWISKILIEEFMILANICSAKLMFQNQINGIFRAHDSEDERAYYTLLKKYHTWLALDDYTHFTSPIRRYADDVVHRVLKMVYLRWLPNPYAKAEIHDIAKHINVSRQVIELIWWQIDTESKSVEKIQRLKNQWEKISTSSFTKDIRENKAIKWKKLPQVLRQEILNDIQRWNKADWAWSVGVFLLSNEDEIKQALYKKIVLEWVFFPKSILNIFNECHVFDGEKNNRLFQVEEVRTQTQIHITFFYRWEQIFSVSDNLFSKNEKDNTGKLRKKVVKKIFEHFLEPKLRIETK